MESLSRAVVQIQIVDMTAIVVNVVVVDVVANAAKKEIIVANAVTTASALSVSVVLVLKLNFDANVVTIAIVMIANVVLNQQKTRV
jgi:hypothetical protein